MATLILTCTDPSIFPELQRAAQLSSAAYTDCNGTAFDIRITKKINEVSTDTQVSALNPLWSIG